MEGIACCGDYLWIAGSHSALRDEAEGSTAAESIASLANVRRAGNRFLLARIPVGRYRVQAPSRSSCASPQPQTAGYFEPHAFPAVGKTTLSRAHCATIPISARFCRFPSKDNGFDVEGLAAAPGGRLFLGLRGPVSTDGHACSRSRSPSIHTGIGSWCCENYRSKRLRRRRVRCIASTFSICPDRGFATSVSRGATC